VYQPLPEMNFEEIIGVILIVVPNITNSVDSASIYNSHAMNIQGILSTIVQWILSSALLCKSHDKFRQCYVSLPVAAMLVADNLSGLSPLLKSLHVQMANGAKAVSGFQWQNEIGKIRGCNLLANSKMFIMDHNAFLPLVA
jgi:hypothetical protein